AIALSELVIDGLRMRLPILFRGPFYAVLVLFFLYPIGLLHLLDTVGETVPRQSVEWTMWGILLFPAAAGVITLTLVFAAWKGPAYTQDSGTPWRWPLYPWSLFVFLGAGVILRSYYLAVSFHPYPGTASGFGVYFLIPFFLSVAVVVFETGRTAKNRL